MNQDLIGDAALEENEELRKQIRQLKGVCSIMRSSLESDCRYNTELLDRLMKMQDTEFDGFHETLNWRKGSRFQVLDSAGEHDPVWVVTPNGEMFELNHTNDHTTDICRAHWIVQVLNQEWDKIRQNPAPSLT